MTRRNPDLPEPLQQTNRTYVRLRGKEFSYFGGCDYFRLSSHPQITAAVKEGLEKFGLNVAASRFTTGNHRLYEQLEARLADFFQVDQATVLSNGYASNLVLAQALAGEFSHALIDARAHQSLRDSLSFLGCPFAEFEHLAVAAVARAVAKCGRAARIILLTDGMFSHSGALAPLHQYLSILPSSAVILVDDAHGAGTLGKNGRGTAEVFGVKSRRIIQTISLSKAFGVYGGAILDSRQLRKKLLSRPGLLRGNTPLPLPLAHAGIQSLRLLREDKSLRRRLENNTRRVLQAVGLNSCATPVPILAVAPETRSLASAFRKRLLREGILPSEIRYGGAPAYFRFAISSEHTSDQLDGLVRACVQT